MVDKRRPPRSPPRRPRRRAPILGNAPEGHDRSKMGGRFSAALCCRTRAAEHTAHQAALSASADLRPRHRRRAQPCPYAAARVRPCHGRTVRAPSHLAAALAASIEPSTGGIHPEPLPRKTGRFLGVHDRDHVVHAVYGSGARGSSRRAGVRRGPRAPRSFRDFDRIPTPRRVTVLRRCPAWFRPIPIEFPVLQPCKSVRESGARPPEMIGDLSSAVSQLRRTTCDRWIYD